MIEFLIALLKESPLLFIILLINIVLIVYIVLRSFIYFSKKKHPERIVSFAVWKTIKSVKMDEIKTIEDAYHFVMNMMKKRGIIERKDGVGYKARKKIIEKLTGEEKNIVKDLFELYERKIYGEEMIKDEENIANDIVFSIVSK